MRSDANTDEIPSDIVEQDRSLAARFDRRLEMAVPARDNPKLQSPLDAVNDDDDLYGLWIVELSNSARLFQLDQLLRNKVAGSGLEDSPEIHGHVREEEKSLLTSCRL